jgi:hypothetical protein
VPWNCIVGEMKFLITSAKRKNAAVAIRQFTIKLDNIALRYLHSQLQFFVGYMQLRDIKYKAMSTKVSRPSEKVLGRRTEQATPYCFLKINCSE